MITDKRINVIVAIGMAIAVAVTCLLMAFSGDTGTTASYQYPEKLFSKDMITIDIDADEDNWQNMLDNATAEEYIMCDIIVEGKKFSSVGIRPKGNSSLTTVANSDSDRFSFKLQFDEYVDDQTCYGLDKFVLNNISADSTYMKEYLSYDLMNYMGVDSPLFTYANITVNGEAWGLYLAVESYDESFVQRVYGTQSGNLYSVKMISGGDKATENKDGTDENLPQGGFQKPTQNDTTDKTTTDIPAADSSQTDISRQQPPSGDRQMPNGNAGGFGGGQMGGGGMGGNNGGSLEYTDDSSDSYSSLFENAVFSSSNEDDFQRVITALENLSTGTDLEEYFDIDQILRYFAVHTTVVNLDSYVSSMQQNYCLYENDGVVTILPWDYNLAFGGFQSGTASSAVNFPIDTPVSGIELAERPLLAKLLEVDEYAEKYHQYLQEIVDGYFNSGLFEETISSVDSLISDSVKNDATAFYTYDEYGTGVETLTQFGLLRAESIEGQLDGTIPSTTDGQTDSTALIDASSINLSDMGSQGGGGGDEIGGGQMGGNKQNFQSQGMPNAENSDIAVSPQIDTATTAIDKKTIIILVSLGILLIAGILFAKKFRRR